MKHDPEDAHNRDSLYYQTKFNMAHGRCPTWLDAVAHCRPERQKLWLTELKKAGVKID